MFAAAWIGIDYTELSFFGLKVASGSSERFVVFVLFSILASGAFYEFSRRIDASVRGAKIKSVSSDLKGLVGTVEAVDGVMERNDISDFADLYYDLRSSLSAPGHDGVDVYRAVRFYKNNLSRAGVGLNIVTMLEHLMVYSVAAIAIFSLTKRLLQ